MKKKRLTEAEFDLLSVFIEQDNRQLSIPEIGAALREKGYNITNKEVEEMLKEEE